MLVLQLTVEKQKGIITWAPDEINKTIRNKRLLYYNPKKYLNLVTTIWAIKLPVYYIQDVMALVS